MKTKNLFIYLLILAAGLLLGWLFFRPSSEKQTDNTKTETTEAQEWICAMHPQIRQNHPGRCPLCAMDLTPVKKMTGSDESIDPEAIVLSKEAVALANVQTTTVGRQRPTKEVHLYGVVQIDERLRHSQVAHTGGRIEKLFVNFTGETVRKGQVIASVYSPDLQTAQQELLEALKIRPSQPALVEAAKEKLRRWKLSEKQIEQIEQSETVSPQSDVVANAQGIVITKTAEQGDYVTPGSVLFEVADLSSVWVVFEAYEADLPYLKKGDKVEYTLAALPGKTFSGIITFIDPLLDKTSRTAKVRVETANPRAELKPEMYANARVKTSLKQAGDAIVIPKTAVLWTGKRSIVYVKQPSETPAFLPREIELGVSLGDSFVVLSGVSEGEEIVTNGAFAIDAVAQLEGKPSMMNSDRATLVVHATLTVQGNCDMCKTTIETAARSESGVRAAEWDGESKVLHLQFEEGKTSVENISKAIAKTGYDTEKDKGDNAAYEALPPCCRYR
ncbi:MAG: efflux RND transporter periplasmic adaptor subunit [Dysgonamonadaceae bacterium]|jgi:Cu(I)/Ag(I) efflux system membrane fusion protein|nr:efflux RND transporter periplasmic adaptor subunit [Dysgonamonadaceae bacterium]